MGKFPGLKKVKPFGMPDTPYNPVTGKHLPLGNDNPYIELEFKKEYGDVIICVDPKYDEDEQEDIIVAKPYFLRKAPFGGEDAEEVKISDEETRTYEYIDPDGEESVIERETTISKDDEDRVINERIYPEYYEKCRILVAKQRTYLKEEGEDGEETVIDLEDVEELSDDDKENTTYIDFIDVNMAGRAWVESGLDDPIFELPVGTTADPETTEWKIEEQPEGKRGVSVTEWTRFFWSETEGDPVYIFNRGCKTDSKGNIIYVGPEVRKIAFGTGACD